MPLRSQKRPFSRQQQESAKEEGEGFAKLIERHAGPHAIVDVFRGHFNGINLAAFRIETFWVTCRGIRSISNALVKSAISASTNRRLHSGKSSRRREGANDRRHDFAT